MFKQVLQQTTEISHRVASIKDRLECIVSTLGLNEDTQKDKDLGEAKRNGLLGDILIEQSIQNSNIDCSLDLISYIEKSIGLGNELKSGGVGVLGSGINSTQALGVNCARKIT